MDFGRDGPAEIAAAIVDGDRARTPSYRPVRGDGARRAAQLIADLL